VTTGEGNLAVSAEIVALLVYLIGGLIYWDQICLAVALGVVVTVLLAARRLWLRRYTLPRLGLLALTSLGWAIWV
jgi:uncharacterized membrane protein (DUF4010 family)